MKISKFDNFHSYILNVRFTHINQRNTNSNLLYIDSLIEMIYEIHKNYVEVKDELVELKASVVTKEIYNAKLDSLIHKLNKFEIYRNYNNEKVKDWIKENELTEAKFFKWHDEIHEENHLYNILNTQMSWLEPNMKPDVESFPFMERYDTYEIQTMHTFFENYIKEHYVEKLLTFLEEQKYSVNNTDSSEIKYDDIFSNNGYILFKYILENHIQDNRGRYADLSYYYRRLFQDNYIHQRPEPFREWFMDKYNESFTKIKTLNEVEKPNRKTHYSQSLDWFKQ